VVAPLRGCSGAPPLATGTSPLHSEEPTRAPADRLLGSGGGGAIFYFLRKKTRGRRIASRSADFGPELRRVFLGHDFPSAGPSYSQICKCSGRLEASSEVFLSNQLIIWSGFQLSNLPASVDPPPHILLMLRFKQLESDALNKKWKCSNWLAFRGCRDD
jgi:hypothetical protein